MRALKVESDIPLPYVRGKYHKYPFGDMKVGDSFALGRTDEVQAVRQAAAHFAVRRGRKWKFSILRMSDGYRCWRVK